MSSAIDTTAPNPDAGSSTPNPGGVPFYTEKGKAQPRAVKGLFRSLKWWAMAITLAWWHLAPFLRWDRGPGQPDQAILIDMPGRRAYFFFLEIWPQEVYYLTGILLISAITLFLMSALAGRVWCGFLCWQTVYTDLFVWVEHLVIGDRNDRIALSRAPWSAGKLGKWIVVNVLWLAIAAACGIGFVLWFGDAPHLLKEIVTGAAPLPSYLFIGVIGGFCYLLAGHARERVCVYMCPYSRFQSAMLDEHSLVVSYEAWRGEPRGHLKGGVQGRPVEEVFAGRGHCVDCNMCVQACPTGIDIRRGNQLACIGCGLCVDACNTVMTRLGLPGNLISYDSNANLLARSQKQPTRSRLIRPRTMIYAVLLAAVGSVMLFSLLTRADVRVDVLHERVPLYVLLKGGAVRNGYDYKILNMIAQQRQFTVTTNIPEARLSVIGGVEDQQSLTLTVPPDSVGSFRVFVTLPKAEGTGNKPLTFVLSEPSLKAPVEKNSFFAMPEN